MSFFILRYSNFWVISPLFCHNLVWYGQRSTRPKVSWMC